MTDVIAEQILESIGCIEQGSRKVFFPSDFEAALSASRGEVVAALMVLEERGYLRVVGTVHCENGHALFEGRLGDAVRKADEYACEMCEEEEEEPVENTVYARAVLTESGARAISAEREKKKRPVKANAAANPAQTHACEVHPGICSTAAFSCT